MRRHHLSDEARIIRGGHTGSSGADAAHTLLQAEPMPTAVLTFNDRSAMGLVDTVVRAGIDVPGTLSVVGYERQPGRPARTST